MFVNDVYCPNIKATVRDAELSCVHFIEPNGAYTTSPSHHVLKDLSLRKGISSYPHTPPPFKRRLCVAVVVLLTNFEPLFLHIAGINRVRFHARDIDCTSSFSIFYWDLLQPIAVCDIDGTLTVSDVSVFHPRSALALLLSTLSLFTMHAGAGLHRNSLP